MNKNQIATKANYSHVTIRDLKKAYQIAAKVVSDYGDVYLPIFKRMHEEMKSFEANNHLWDLAIKLGKESD
ncbi:hypothetical protein KXQ82_05765 [Mucilaginibacter sp. HMF5004]|uniref:hypothetical protein n=1 Tax=Mucilaginibacter rivuli TaxID=2857527 RepID=UPI001C5D7BA6|nr:hypothetical protein [Mucilaginibacter rivuli]MBW4889210.1 hypothetical protein [Mucilaginibacter rivuli]